jgi:hypothetical protein
MAARRLAPPGTAVGQAAPGPSPVRVSSCGPELGNRRWHIRPGQRSAPGSARTGLEARA